MFFFNRKNHCANFHSAPPTERAEIISGIGLRVCVCVCPSVITSNMIIISARRLH